MFNITENELLILNVVNGRLYTPIEVIIKVIFRGDIIKATESIRRLVDCKMLEYAVNNRITITTAGRMSVRKQRASRSSLNY